jgi:hypothetical protein
MGCGMDSHTDMVIGPPCPSFWKELERKAKQPNNPFTFIMGLMLSMKKGSLGLYLTGLDRSII